MKKITAKLLKLFNYIKRKVQTIDLKSLSTTLSIAFITVSGIILLGNSAINTYINYNSNCELVENQQHIIADEAVKQVRNYIHKKLI